MALKPRQNVQRAKSQPNIDKGSIVIDAGSLVYDNKWLSYKGTVFGVIEYISSVVDGTVRKRFFRQRSYALQLLIGIDTSGALQVVEGTQVPYTTKQSVPIPSTYDMIPLMAVLLVQDGSADVVNGFVPLNDSSVTYFSGAGNILEKNTVGEAALDDGLTGQGGSIGITGLVGVAGLTGRVGHEGYTGSIGIAPTGMQGLEGITGINWDIHIPFEYFY
jgi:hypothetical protein